MHSFKTESIVAGITRKAMNKILKQIHPYCNVLALLGIVLSLYLVFIYVPNERIMGPVQRIFYFHVSCAIACYFAIATMLISGIWLLVKNNMMLGPVVLAAGEVACIFSSITLFTGMTWGDAAWNTPFRFEPRLVSFLLLFLVLLSTQIMKLFVEGDKLFVMAAVLGIVAACTSPLVIFSVKLLPQSVQLHPQVLGNRGLEFPGYKMTFLVTLASIALLQFSLLFLRARQALLENRIRILSAQ